MYTYLVSFMGPRWHRHLDGHAACGLSVLVCHFTADCDVINPAELYASAWYAARSHGRGIKLQLANCVALSIRFLLDNKVLEL
jgi:hypothetical protein